MRILQVCYRDGFGGAANAAMRLHLALLDSGIDSNYLCGRKDNHYPQTEGFYTKRMLFFNKVKNQLVRRGMNASGFGVQRSLNIFPSGVHRLINKLECDLVHLHWVNAEMLSVEEIGKIEKPIAWTLHDLWPVMGTRGYPQYGNEFERVKNGYTKHNWPGKEVAGMPWDLDRWMWRRKKRAWVNFNPTIIVPSQWAGGVVQDSALLGRCDVQVVPNTLDLSVFRPLEQSIAREQLNIPSDKFVILSGSALMNQNERKGQDLLRKALEVLPQAMRKRMAFAVFGSDRRLGSCAEIPVYNLGVSWDEKVIAAMYNAADIMCVPSRMETLGQTASEALACGTPVVAFGATGLLDVVTHQESGYLARPYESTDFCKGIGWLFDLWVNNAEQFTEIKKTARISAEKRFSPEKIAQEHLSVYKKVLSSKG